MEQPIVALVMFVRSCFDQCSLDQTESSPESSFHRNPTSGHVCTCGIFFSSALPSVNS